MNNEQKQAADDCTVMCFGAAVRLLEYRTVRSMVGGIRALIRAKTSIIMKSPARSLRDLAESLQSKDIADNIFAREGIRPVVKVRKVPNRTDKSSYQTCLL